jgi:ATP-dependent Clp protease ATP-binding subunit ClpA
MPPTQLPITDRVKRALKVASKEQHDLRHPVICAEHVLLGLLDDKRSLASFVLRELKVDVRALEDRARAELKKGAPETMVSDMALLGGAPRWVAELKQVSIGTEHMLLGILASKSAAAAWLADAGVSVDDARDTTQRLLGKVQRGSGEVATPEDA